MGDSPDMFMDSDSEDSEKISASIGSININCIQDCGSDSTSPECGSAEQGNSCAAMQRLFAVDGKPGDATDCGSKGAHDAKVGRPLSPDDEQEKSTKRAKQEHTQQTVDYSLKKLSNKRPLQDELSSSLPSSSRPRLELPVEQLTQPSSPVRPKSAETSREDHGNSRGVPLSSLRRMSVSAPSVPPIHPGQHHTVLVRQPITSGQVPMPYPARGFDAWDATHVRMPCSPSSLYTKTEDSSETVVRWTVITEALSRNLTSITELREAILSYNRRYIDKWALQGLQVLVNEFTEEEETAFFTVTLPGMCRLALRLPELVTQAPPLLRVHQQHTVSLSQLQIASLLANAFFCTFPLRDAKGPNRECARYPDINFNRLLCHREPRALEKIKCLLNYFRVVTREDPVGVVTLCRQEMAVAGARCWKQSQAALPRLYCSDGAVIEDMTGMLQVDFANRFLGGGVLGLGSVQEEIRFVLCPELLITRLLTEALDKKEALIVIGVEQYNRGTGYGNNFLFAGPHRDTTTWDAWGRRLCQVAAIDAVHFTRLPHTQYEESFIVRELNKAYAGFCPLSGSVGDPVALATGNWGCGAFKGDPKLKALIQLAASGYAGRDMAYLTFYDAELMGCIADMYDFLAAGGVTVGVLVQCMCQYGLSEQPVDGTDLYNHIYRTLSPSPAISSSSTAGSPRQLASSGSATQTQDAPQPEEESQATEHRGKDTERSTGDGARQGRSSENTSNDSWETN